MIGVIVRKMEKEAALRNKSFNYQEAWVQVSSHSWSFVYETNQILH